MTSATTSFHLAGEPPAPPPGPPQDVPSGILRLLDQLVDTAAFVADAKYDVLAWNPLAAALMGDFSTMRPEQRNQIRRRFLGTPTPDTPHSLSHQEQFAVTAAGHLRAAAAKYPKDPGIRNLVDELLAASPEFAEIWARHDLMPRRERRKIMWHPETGEIPLTCEVLLVSERDQHVVLYTAEPGSPGYEALQLLKVLGTQKLSGTTPR